MSKHPPTRHIKYKVINFASINKSIMAYKLPYTCHFAPSQLVPAQLVRFQLVPDDNLSNAILSHIIKNETCPRFFDILVEHNVGIKMKNLFVNN